MSSPRSFKVCLPRTNMAFPNPVKLSQTAHASQLVLCKYPVCSGISLATFMASPFQMVSILV